MKKCRNLKKKGFTLVELMLVVSIILVLLGFLIPRFSAYQDKVKTTKAVNTAKQIETATMASYGDKDGKFDVADVQQCVTSLTSAEEAKVLESASGDQNIEITYKSDGKFYTLDIDAQSNSYIVKDGTKQIFPKVSVKSEK